MDTDCYKVEVLHYLNPHLIWIEVTDPAFSKNDDFVFEQVGVYGILPLEMTIDDIDQAISTQRGKEWMGAAALCMRKALKDAQEVYFVPTHIDRRTSIFDNNIHKYGELIIITANEKQRKLSKILIKSGLAVFDECLFYQELCSGNLKTKLSPAASAVVIAELEKHYKKKDRTKNEWEKSLQKNTTVHHQIRNLESQLTEKNLKALGQNQSNMIDVDSLVQKKCKDFEICKDVDEVSVGCAVQRLKNKKELNVSLLKKKLKLVEECQSLKLPTKSASVFEETKKFLHENATKKETKKILVENVSKTETKNIFLENESKTDTIPFERDNYNKSSTRRTQSKSHKIPEYDVRTQMRVAYGPPEADCSLLVLKIVPRVEETPAMQEVVIEDVPKQTDFYGDVDSVVALDLNDRLVKCKIDNSEVDSKHGNFDLSKDSVQLDDDKVLENGINDSGGSKAAMIDNKNITGHVKYDEQKVSDSFQRHMALKLQSKSRDVVKKPTERAVEQDVSDISLNSSQEKSPSSSILKKKLQLLKECERRLDASQSSISDTSNKDSSTSVEDIKPKKRGRDSTDLESDDESVNVIIRKLDSEYSRPITNPNEKTDSNIIKIPTKNHVNPFKNVDSNLSVFVDKLVSPILMVHTRKNNRIQPSFELRDMHFNNQIMGAFKVLKIEKPMMLQTVSWLTILRGYSLFMISPKSSGKTLGYLPAVCQLIADSINEICSIGPICIIVCATAYSVAQTERLARLLLRQNERILACYSGMSELDLATSILNGCELLICTPSILVRLLMSGEFGLDLRRLQTVVLDDCERLSEVYVSEIKYFLHKIKEMLKKRVIKEFKVQYVLASRIWCDFMRPLATKAPDTVISISAFQECVLYAKAGMRATFVTKENKLNEVLHFLEQTDRSKKTVIVCRSDDEVDILQDALKKLKYVLFSADSKMTVQNLYSLSLAWEEYTEPISGPILICCDSNLMHLNVTDAHYLMHYSLPHLFSMFCKRFSVLNNNYPSIFTDDDDNVKIKILLEEENVEQLPKILHFIKRCTKEVPQALDEMCEKVLEEKDQIKAKTLVPLCDGLLTLGECSDFWNCQERHAVIKKCDEPLEWIPKQGVITFKLLHYHTAVLYSAGLLSCTYKGRTTKYPQTANMLSMKIATYFAKESNRMLHGTPKVGDIAAVALKQNFFVRCQVVKILSYYNNGNPDYVLVKLIDEEKLEKTKDIYLYYLPEAMKETNTHVVQVRMANIQPKDKDITFSDLARDALKNITDNDEVFMRGEIKLVIGNCIIVDNLEACRELSSMNKVVVRANFKQELEAHASENPNHVPKLEKLCQESGITLYKHDNENLTPKKQLSKPRWAHLEHDNLSAVRIASTENPGTFFVRLVKFEKCMNLLIQDIQKHMVDKPEYITDIKKGDIVLAELPDDGMYERARVDEIYKDKVKCFFVDQGDWRDVSVKRIAEVTDKFVTQIPFQAIECRLVGVLPAGEEWTEFATNWFSNCFEDKNGDLKLMYAQYFTKEKPVFTGGHKYGIAVIDTYGEVDLVINKMIVEVNMARADEDEIGYLENVNFERVKSSNSSEDDWEHIDNEQKSEQNEVALVNTQNQSSGSLLFQKPIRSVPLVGSDDDSDLDKFDINMIDEFMAMFKPAQQTDNKLPAIENGKTENIDTIKEALDTKHAAAKYTAKVKNNIELNSKSSSEVSSKYNSSEVVAVPPKKIEVLDSDDITSSQSSQVTENLSKSVVLINSTTVEPTKLISEINDELRNPKLYWRQTKEHIFVKIMLIGVDDYKIEIQERHLSFEADANDTKYGFDIELYGVINDKESKHCNKGQYILVTLKKILTRNWLLLTRNGVRKWIVYDVDHIEESSSEEEEYCTPASVLKHTLDKSDSETDEELMDDISFKYKRYD